MSERKLIKMALPGYFGEKQGNDFIVYKKLEPVLRGAFNEEGEVAMVTHGPVWHASIDVLCMLLKDIEKKLK